MFRGSNGDRTFDTGLRGDSGDAWCVYDATASDNRFMIDTSGNVKIPNDSVNFSIGASNDLKLTHDGTHSRIIDDGPYATSFQTNEIRFHDQSGNFEYLARFVANSFIRLYYDNGVKFETTSNGAIIDNTVRIENVNNKVSSMVDAKQNIEFKVHQTNGQSALQGAIKSSGVSGWGGELQFYCKNADSNPSGSLTHRASLDVSGHFKPQTSSQDLGGTSNRWSNIYTNDLHLSNEGHSNDVDGTWGDWTMQEGESDLFLKNNRSGKTYKFNLTEVS